MMGLHHFGTVLVPVRVQFNILWKTARRRRAAVMASIFVHVPYTRNPYSMSLKSE